MKPVGKPDAGNPHVRFDERGGETAPAPLGTAPLLDSTTFFQNKREAADFLSFPYFGEKQSVCGAC